MGSHVDQISACIRVCVCVYIDPHACSLCLYVLAHVPCFYVMFVLVRLAVSLVLRSKLDEVVAAFGVCCSSFIPINRGTSSRDILCPEGNEQVVSVRKANKMMSRLGVLQKQDGSQGFRNSFACRVYIHAYIYMYAYTYIYISTLHAEFVHVYTHTKSSRGFLVVGLFSWYRSTFWGPEVGVLPLALQVMHHHVVCPCCWRKYRP